MEYFAIHTPGFQPKGEASKLWQDIRSLQDYFVDALISWQDFQKVTENYGMRRSLAMDARGRRDNPRHNPSREEALELWKQNLSETINAGGETFSYVSRRPFMAAKTFIYAVDSFAKQLKITADKPEAPAELKNFHADLLASFPDLLKVRNSAHHPEDRIRGLKTGGKPIQVEVDPGVFERPAVLMVDCLSGNSYTCTLDNGQIGNVEVSQQSVVILQTILQAAIDSFEWDDRGWDVIP